MTRIFTKMGHTQKWVGAKSMLLFLTFKGVKLSIKIGLLSMMEEMCHEYKNADKAATLICMKIKTSKL